ncbi:hypothetical protein GCM10014713_06070 [Streptomyces purpureus]|uniref:Uncharacterized protein n=1 Tax=Streptomyces purpureus TaxID=1951 RepID=A0A918LLA1_9ACTN|nr:hypothetical protein GCM10014713_06070 [Streptomyces purpureus]
MKSRIYADGRSRFVPPGPVARRKREPGAIPGLSRSGEWERTPSEALGSIRGPGKRRPVDVRRKSGGRAHESEDLPTAHVRSARAVHGDLEGWVGGAGGSARVGAWPSPRCPGTLGAGTAREDMHVITAPGGGADRRPVHVRPPHGVRC